MHRLRTLVPSANDLFCFEAAARRRSFTAAAQELNISQPAVSKTIRRLEAATGLRLFNRDHKRLELTAAGQRLYQEVQASFDHLHMVISALRRRQDGAGIRVSFSAAFVQLWLLPRLHDFRARHPQVALRIEESSRDDLDLAAENIDLSARLGDGNWPGTAAWPLADEEVLPVCSPGYLDLHGRPQGVADLPGHMLIDFEERYRTRMGWREWLERQGVPAARLNLGFVCSDALTALEAAVLGQGIALGWRHLVADHLAAGRLVRPVAAAWRSGQSMWLVAASARPLAPGAALFRDWLLAQAVR